MSATDISYGWANLFLLLLNANLLLLLLRLI